MVTETATLNSIFQGQLENKIVTLVFGPLFILINLYLEQMRVADLQLYSLGIGEYLPLRG